MKFKPEYRNSVHRDNIEKVSGSIVSGEPLVKEAVPDKPLTEYEKPNYLVATQLFGIPTWEVQKEDLETAENLLRYIAKRHVNTVSQMLGKRSYTTYIHKGYALDPNTPKAIFEEAEFTPEHELPHYLISWLLNSTEQGNTNSVTPTYIEEYKNNKTVLDMHGVRRDYLEEVYTQMIDFDAGTGKSLANEIVDFKKKGVSFEGGVTSLVATWCGIESDALMQYDSDAVEDSKVIADSKSCKERFLEVVTASEEEREKLKIVYPVECFVYDVCRAHYFSDRNDPRKVYKVYQKYFARLLEKANANPGVYKRKVLRS